MNETETVVNEVVWYLVKTNMHWARAKTLAEALDHYGLRVKRGRNKGAVRSDTKVVAWKNTQTETNKLTEEDIKYYNNHWSGGPWNVGDYWLPSVDDFGGVHANGKMELVIKNFANDDDE